MQFLHYRDSHRIVKRGNLIWSLNLDEGIDLSVYLFGAFERSTFRAYSDLINPGDVVFDIGANSGAHTLHFAQIVGNLGRVLAFEPTNYAFGRLRANLDLNSSLESRTELHQIAFASPQDVTLRTELYSSWPLNDYNNLHATHGGRLHSTTGAKFMSLDEFVNLNGIDRLDFIKLDVDGDEPRIISGALETLKRFHPSILMEWCPKLFLDPIVDSLSIQSALTELGYGVSIVSHRGVKPSSWIIASRKLPALGSVNLYLQ